MEQPKGFSIGFLKVVSHARTTKKKTSIKPSQGSLEASKSIQNKMGCEIYTSHRCLPITKGNAIATEANHVLGLPLIVST